MFPPPPPEPTDHPGDLARYYLTQAATVANAAYAHVTDRQPAQEVDKLVRLTEALVAVGRLALDLDTADRARRQAMRADTQQGS